MKLKNISLIILALLMSFGLTACSNNKNKSANNVNPGKSSEVDNPPEGTSQDKSNKPLTTEEEIKQIKGKLDKDKLTLVFLNQYGNPLSLATCQQSSSGLCGIKLMDALGDPLPGKLSLVPHIKQNKWDDDQYIFQYSETLPAGKYSIHYPGVLKDGKIEPAYYAGEYADDQRSDTVTRYFDSLEDKTFDVPGEEGWLVRIMSTQKSVAYSDLAWKICAHFQNEVGTSVKLKGGRYSEYNDTPDKTSSLKSDGKLIMINDEIFSDTTLNVEYGEESGSCISSGYLGGKYMDELSPGKYVWHVERDGFEPTDISFEFPDIKDWSDDEVRAKNPGYINLGDIVLKKKGE